jgi:hypothetical protein
VFDVMSSMIVEEVRRARAVLAGVTLQGVDDDELDALVVAVAELRGAADRLWLEVAARADARRLHQRHHARDSATWLASVGGERVGAARRDVELGAALAASPVLAEASAAALTGLARCFLDHAGDPATTRVGRPHVLVLVDLEVLEGRAPGSATLGSGTVISGTQAAQLAAEADISRVVMSGRSQVLDVGRSVRSVPPAIAKAIIARDRHCRYRGCTSPPWACEIHHLVPWANGGPTSVQNLGLLCWHHHKLVHAGDPTRLRPGLDGRWTLDPPHQEAAA